MKVLLYSGGLDSWLIDKLWKPDMKIYIDIAGSYNEDEKKKLPSDVKIIPFPFLGQHEMENRFVPLRNLYFLMIASHYGDEICLGATAGDGSNDKSLEFLEETEKTLRKLWNDKKVHKDITIEKRFVKMSKAEILAEYLNNGHNADEVRQNTFSCYTPDDGKECLACYPCFRKFAILSSFGAHYSEDEERRMWDYIKKNIIPTKEEGGYEGTYYTDRGDESIYLIEAVDRLKSKYEGEKE